MPTDPEVYDVMLGRLRAAHERLVYESDNGTRFFPVPILASQAALTMAELFDLTRRYPDRFQWSCHGLLSLKPQPSQETP